MAAPCGRWATARAATPACRGGDGRRRCFARRCPPPRSFSSPRAWAFTLLGLDAYCAIDADNAAALRLQRILADRLVAILAVGRNP